MLSALQVGYDDPDYIANLVFDRLVFGFHPYGRPNEGTPDSIGRITRDDLVTFHRTWFVPNNALIAVVGDLSAAEPLAAAEKSFASWALREVPAINVIDPPPPTRRVVVIDRPKSRRDVGHIAIPRTHPISFRPSRFAFWAVRRRLFGVLRSSTGRMALQPRPHVQAERRRRRGDGHAVVGPRRVVAADGSRVLATAVAVHPAELTAHKTRPAISRCRPDAIGHRRAGARAAVLRTGSRSNYLDRVSQ